MWNLIKDGMPEKDVFVLVADKDDIWVASWFNLGENIYWNTCGCYGTELEPSGTPTHWMELPDKPTADRLRVNS